MNLRKIVCLAALLMPTAFIHAAENSWTDMTSWFMVNPHFDNDSEEGWQWESNASTQAVRVNCISFYNGNFNLHQELKNLPKGRYRLSVQGFYRTGDNGTAYNAHQNGTENITASLYVGTTKKQLVSLYSESLSYNAADRCYENSGRYYPDGKEAALVAFDKGMYWNQMEFDAEGSIVIGVECSEYNGNNYCVLDNFKLEYSGATGPMWIDLTDQFLMNPRFTNNDQSGWTWDSSASSQTARCDCMEFWNGPFDIYQKLYGLTKGKYRLSLQGFYRTTDNDWAYSEFKSGEEVISAYMYAGNTQQPLVSVYSEPRSSSVSGGWGADGKYYPNSMESARVFFDDGRYWNTMEFEAEGDIQLGLRSESNWYSNWCIFDNFKLEYFGELTSATGVKLTLDREQLIVGEKATVKAEVTPVNAMVKTLTWKSDNPRVATVDERSGEIAAVGQGTAVITATTIDGSNISASVEVTVTRNKVTAASLVINEIMASNVDEFISPAFNFDGWIELYNPSEQSIALGGLVISDAANGEGPWTMPITAGILPAKGYRVVWFDSNSICPENAPFSLDVDGGTLVIADDEGNEIVRQTYPASMERVSYARTSDGADEWGTTATATPGRSNNGVTFAAKQLAAPVVNQPSQLFSGQLSVSVDIPAGTTLRYTEDGTVPTLENGETSTTGQFTLNDITRYMLRFRLFADGYLPSRVTTRSYIPKFFEPGLPIVSVVCDWDYLYDDSIGVYTQGVNGRPGNGQSSKCNWNMDWERPVNLSFIDRNGEMVLNQDVNLEMCGGWSRAYFPHSFKLKGSKELGGDKNLLYPFFNQKPYIRNRTLQIRNGGNDTSCRIKDAALQYIMQTSGIDLDCQSYEPVHEFINGSYIGVLNMREPNNKHYVYSNYGWDDDEIDQFEMSPDSGYVQKCGTPDVYNELVDVLSPDAANSETYEEICRVLDIDEYINYMAAEMYMGGTDWPQNNVKAFRHRDGGRFRFVVYDLDGTFATNNPFNDFMGKETYTFDQLYPTSLGRIRDKIRFVTLFKNLLKNADFRRRFIDAYCIMGGSVFQKNRTTTVIDQLVKNVEPSMNVSGESTNPTAGNLKSQLNNRLTNATNALKNYTTFGISHTTTQRVTLKSDVEGAKLFINGQAVPTGQFNGNLFAPVTLRAEAPAGYVFTGWLKSGKVTSEEAEMKLPAGNLDFVASFRAMTDSEKQAGGITPVRINEVSGSNDSYIDEYGKKGDWIELYNTTDQEIDVEGMYLTDNKEKPTNYMITKGKTSARTVIAPHGYLVIWCDNKRATTNNGLHASFKIDGDGGLIQLMAADRSWTDVFNYPAHDARTTIGRYPDGCSQIYSMNMATIGKGNITSSYVTKVGGDDPVIDAIATVSSANGFRLRYGAQQLIVKSDDATQAVVEVYTPDGALVERATVDVMAGSARLDVAHLPAGFYVARATDDQGTRVACKFMK